jgi:ADP-ribose pyrophosphatase YjhB (NUDIX family)
VEIRLRAVLIVVEEGKILLVPHYQSDSGEVQWNVPGGKVEFGESIYAAVRREFYEETGLQTEITGLFDVSEVVLPEKPYHSIIIAFSGKITGGQIRPEADHPFGRKLPAWFNKSELCSVSYHPATLIEKAMGIENNRW